MEATRLEVEVSHSSHEKKTVNVAKRTTNISKNKYDNYVKL